ncbi:MAG: hypothetical protein K2L00_04215, partial [Muribaculaceae bacterium]|nr:hypothetical protein [Muribaculaceae bacterium]
MKKLLLSSACVALACTAFAALTTPKALKSSKAEASTEINLAKLPQMASAKKITPTPETTWGEWKELGTSTVTFPEEEFLYTGTADHVPTFVRTDENDQSHMQYRFDGLLATNTVADIEPSPLYVDVYGNEATVYSQQLPPVSLGEYDEYYPGPFAICDFAVLYDMESYRMLNQYKANPMSMMLNLCIYDESQGEFEGLIFMGEVGIRLNLKQAFSIPETCVIGGDMGMGLLKVEDLDEEVWSIQYAIIKGDGNIIDFDSNNYDTIIDRIINKDENLMIMYWMAGDIMATPMEGPGVYTLGAVAYDENDQVLSTATCTVYNMPNESWNWTSLGKATVSEDFLRNVFTMNLDNAGIAHDTPAEYEVEIQESNSTPGLYRLVNMYGPSHPYAAIFEYLNEFPVYTYIDCSSPEFCYIYNMPTGFIVKGDTSGEISLGCEPSIYFDEGF